MRTVPHLLDIDGGDTCHHCHNASEKFCTPFEKFAEKLFTDVHNDHKWSSDLRDYMSSICSILGIKYTMPQEYISHRWLSVYDTAVDTLRLFDALTVFYHPFLSPTDKALYLVDVVAVHRRHRVTDEGKEGNNG